MTLRKLPTSTLRTTLLATVLALVPAVSLAADLFQITGAEDLASVASVAATSSRRITVDPSALAAGAETLAFALLDGSRYEALGGTIERRGSADLAWRGRLGGDPDYPVILTLKNGYVIGLVYSPDGLYELATGRDGGQLLSRLDPARFPPCAAGVAPPTPRIAQLRPTGVAPASRGTAPDPPDQIDVMSLYTPQARDGAGGVAAIEATIQAAVDLANTAFANSDMLARFTLVHTELANHNDAGNISSDLNWVASDPTVAAVRDAYAADMVSLITESGGGFCGIARLLGNEDPVAFGSRAYQVTARSCAVGNLSYPHEHGHNMGLQHNPENGAPPAQAYQVWAYGHYHNGMYRTVMSYSNPCTSGCTRHPYFSNPDVTFMGLPTGIADQRDNHRTSNDTAPIVANWRTSLAVFSDGFESGDVGAWSAAVP